MRIELILFAAPQFLQPGTSNCTTFSAAIASWPVERIIRSRIKIVFKYVFISTRLGYSISHLRYL